MSGWEVLWCQSDLSYAHASPFCEVRIVMEEIKQWVSCKGQVTFAVQTLTRYPKDILDLDFHQPFLVYRV